MVPLGTFCKVVGELLGTIYSLCDIPTEQGEKYCIELEKPETDIDSLRVMEKVIADSIILLETNKPVARDLTTISELTYFESIAIIRTGIKLFTGMTVCGDIPTSLRNHDDVHYALLSLLKEYKPTLLGGLRTIFMEMIGAMYATSILLYGDSEELPVIPDPCTYEKGKEILLGIIESMLKQFEKPVGDDKLFLPIQSMLSGGLYGFTSTYHRKSYVERAKYFGGKSVKTHEELRILLIDLFKEIQCKLTQVP